MTSELGKAALDVLTAMNRNFKSSEIARRLCTDYPRLFSAPAKAARFVDDMVRKYG